MINFNQTDKDCIEKNKEGTYAVHGVKTLLDLLGKKFGEDKKREFKEEMKKLGYDFYFEGKKMERIPIAHFIAFDAGKKHFFNLSEEMEREIGRDVIKGSFLIRVVSRIFISLDSFCKNANSAWHRYFSEGKLVVTDIDKEKKKVTLELRDFFGHPSLCRCLEGNLEQSFFFVTGREATCREEECVLKGGNLHRYIINWE